MSDDARDGDGAAVFETDPAAEWARRQRARATAGPRPALNEAEAQARLLAVRATLPAEFAPAPPMQARRFYAEQAARRDESLADVLARALPLASAAPSPGALEQDRRDRVQLAFNDAEIPESFRPCRCGGRGGVHRRGCARWESPGPEGCSWETLAELRNPDGLPSLGGVLDEHDRFCTGAEAVTVLRRRMNGARRVVLLGETREGKSVTAAAALDGEIRGGTTGARWISTRALKHPAAMEKALQARLLVLDDIGYEMGNAGEETGLAAQRGQPVIDLFGELVESRSGRSVITTFMPLEKMAKMYGRGCAGRVYEGAVTIRIVRAPS